MASEMMFYDNFYDLQWGALNLKTATINVCLVKSTYTFDATDTQLADVLGAESVNEVANGSGYTSGGETLTAQAVTVETTPKRTKFTAANATWTALTATFRYAVFYVSGTVESLVNPPLCAVLLDTTPADISIAGTDYTLMMSANGIFTSAIV